MNNLVRYLKTISTTCLWVAVFASTLSHAYAFDDDRLDLTITNFFDSLSYKYKGFDLGIKKISIGEVFDDNITFVKENKKDDFITNLGLVLGVNYKGKTRTFELTGHINSITFAQNSDFNNITQHIDLNFINEFSKRDRLSLKNVFTYYEAPDAAVSGDDYFSQQFGRVGGRFEYFQNKFYIDYSHDIAKHMSISINYANEINIFSGGTVRPDSLVNRPGFDLKYVFSPTATIFSLSYSFTDIEFDTENNAIINSIGPGIRQYITKKLYFDGKTGVDFIDSFDDENFTRPFFLTSLTYTMDERTQARISFDKRYDTTPYIEDIYNNWRTSFSLTRQILERLGCSLSISYGDGEYVSSDYEEELWVGRSSLKYQISRNLEGSLSYTYSDLNNNVENSGYSKNTVFIGLSAGF